MTFLLFLLKRLLWMVLTLWIVFTVSFFLMRALPGDPLSSERQMEPAIRKAHEKKYQLDKPLMVQYRVMLTNYLSGDLGLPYKIKDFTVNEVISQGLPVSAALGILAVTYALGLGLAAGMVSAVFRGSYSDYFLRSLATLGISFPNFVIAGVMIILFVFYLPLFPAAGWGSFQQLLLPAFCLGAPYAAYIARLSRTGMLDVLSQDYIRTAYAKGLPGRRVIIRHALKGALIPVVSFLGPAIAGIITGSLVIEQIFFLPGLGVHFIEAAIQRDYTLAMGMVMLYTALLYLMNFIVDVSYSLLDPRVKLD